MHQDHAGWGDAVTRAGIQRDIRMIKECGMNTIRGSHYPHHPYFAQVCDEKGILFGLRCASGELVVTKEMAFGWQVPIRPKKKIKKTLIKAAWIS